MTIAVCTFWTPELALFGAQTEANKRAYCERHGYAFHCPREGKSDRPPSWEKLLVLADATRESEWAWWIDADAIVTNPEIRLESLIVPGRDMVVAADVNGLNCGVFGLRSCPWSRLLLADAWACDQFINHEWWEQAAIRHLLRDPDRMARVEVIEQRRMNAYPDTWQPGDFILHLPGMANEERAAVFDRFFATGAIRG
jgi:hypothetical protein